MGIFRLIAGVVALIAVLGGYMSWKYSATSACEAAEKAITLETPEILEGLADTDPRFKALKVGSALFSGLDTAVEGAATKVARDEMEDSNTLDCAYLVARREFDGPGFRDEMSKRMADRLANSLSF